MKGYTMSSIFSLEGIKALGPDELREIQRGGLPVVIHFEDAGDDFLAYVSDHATEWLGTDAIRTVDARRFMEDQEWKAPMLTSEVLPKTIIVDPARWGDSFADKVAALDMTAFYSSNPVLLDYNDAFEVVFLFSTFYHHTMVSVTDFCNLRCRGCSFHGDDSRYDFAASRGKTERQELKEEDYYLFLDQRKPGDDLLFCGTGELFVSKKAMPYIREAIRRGLHVRILTNGMLVDDKVARELVELGVGAVLFSIDGHTKEIVESIRLGADYDRILANLRNLMRVRDEAGSGMIIGVQSGWFDEVKTRKDEILEFWKEFGIDTFSFFAEQVGWFQCIPMHEDKVMPVKTHACFNSLITPVLMTNGYVAPCTGNYQAEWSSLSSSWMKHISEAPFDEIIRYYRKMRTDPASPYRQRCAMCIGRLSTYVNSEYVSAYAEGYRFSERKSDKEAAFVKFSPQDEKTGFTLKKLWNRLLRR